MKGLFAEEGESLNRILFRVYLCVVVALVFYNNLRPGTWIALQPNSSYLISNGGDSITVPYNLSVLHETFLQSKRDFFSFQVPVKKLNPPEGMQVPYSFFFRIFSLIPNSWQSYEASFALYLHFLFFANFFALLLFGRERNWKPEISVCLALAFAFLPFTRARSVVHADLVGVFAIPFAFLFLEICKKKNVRWIDCVLAVFSLLSILWGAQYFLLCLLTLSPLFVFYLFFGTGALSSVRIIRAVGLALPSLLFLLFTFFIQKKSSVLLDNGQAFNSVHDLFFENFGAKVLDYFTGDVGITLLDKNPLKQFLNQKISPVYLDSVTERAHGIFWTVWILLGFTLFGWKKNPSKQFSAFFLVAAVLAFWCSLGPGSPMELIRWWIPEFRISNRFSPIVAFSLLVVIGEWWSFCEIKKIHRFVLLALLPFELLAVSPLPVFQLPEPAERLTNESDCGTVLALPYVSATRDGKRYNAVLAALRNSNCALLNRANYDDFSPEQLASISPDTLRCLGVRWLMIWNNDLNLCLKYSGILRENGVCELASFKTPKSAFAKDCFSQSKTQQ